MLTGKAIACLSPSIMEMSQGKAMDCCMERCRMETTHEEAQKACEQSRHALSPKETLSSHHDTCDNSLVTILSDISPLLLFSSPLLEPIDRIKQLQTEVILLRHYPSVQIYTSIQTFLI